MKIDWIGNIFMLDKQINVKTVAISILLTFFVAFFKFILEQQFIFSIKDIMYPLLALSLFYILIKSKIILHFIKEYFSFNLVYLSGTVFEIIIFITIVYVSKYSLYGWILGIFWIFSGILLVTILCTKAIFNAEINYYMDIIQIFAYSRLAYFLIVLILISNLLSINEQSYLITFYILMFIIILWFTANLNPYIVKNQNVKNVIELIRFVQVHKKIKIGQLKNFTNLSESDFHKSLSKLSRARYLKIQNKKVELGKAYRYIYKREETRR